jgi:hypothetical protein
MIVIRLLSFKKFLSAIKTNQEKMKQGGYQTIGEMIYSETKHQPFARSCQISKRFSLLNKCINSDFESNLLLINNFFN